MLDCSPDDNSDDSAVWDSWDISEIWQFLGPDLMDEDRKCGTSNSPSPVLETHVDELDYLIKDLDAVADAQHCETCQPRTNMLDPNFRLHDVQRPFSPRMNAASTENPAHTSGWTSQQCPGSVLDQCFSPPPTACFGDEFQLDLIDVNIPQTTSSASKCVQLLPNGVTQQTRAHERTCKRRHRRYGAMSRRDNVDREQLNERSCTASAYDYKAEAAHLAKMSSSEVSSLGWDQLVRKAGEIGARKPKGNRRLKETWIHAINLRLPEYYEQKLRQLYEAP